MAQKQWFCVALMIATGIGAYFAAISLRDKPPIVDVAPEYDLGMLEKGTYHVVPIKVVNRGDADLTIQDIRTSCGTCPKVKRGAMAPPSPFSVSRHGSIEIPVEIAVRETPGTTHRAFLSFRTNDPNRPVVQIDFLHQVGGGIVARPPSVSVLSTTENQRESISVDILAAGLPNSAAISRVEATEGVAVEEITRLVGAEEHLGFRQLGQLKISVAAPTERQPRRGNVQVYLNCDEARPSLSIPICAERLVRVGVYPSEIVLSSAVHDGITNECQIICRSTKSEPFSVEWPQLPNQFEMKELPLESSLHHRKLLLRLIPRPRDQSADESNLQSQFSIPLRFVFRNEVENAEIRLLVTK